MIFGPPTLDQRAVDQPPRPPWSFDPIRDDCPDPADQCCDDWREDDDGTAVRADDYICHFHRAAAYMAERDRLIRSQSV